MSHFQAFDSWEEAAAAMTEAEQEANAKTTDEQRAISWGDHWVTAFDGMLIFGRVSTRPELDESERQLGAGAEERKQEDEMIVSAHQRGYRFGWCYSVVEPNGELGSTHISNMVAITAEQFTQAKSHDWNALDMVACQDCTRWLAGVVRRGRALP